MILCASCGERIEQAPICPICLGTAVLNDNYELIEEIGSGSQEPESFIMNNRSFDFETMSVSAAAESALRRLLDPEASHRPDTREAIDLFHELIKAGNSPTALVRRSSSEMASQTFEGYSRLLSQPGHRKLPDWLVETHTMEPDLTIEICLFGNLLFIFLLLVMAKAWWMAGVAVFVTSVSIPLIRTTVRAKRTRILKEGILTQAVVTKHKVLNPELGSTLIRTIVLPNDFVSLSIEYRYEVEGITYDGTWVRDLPLNRDPNVSAPEGTIPVLYLPNEPSKSLLLYAFPWKRDSDSAPMQLRLTRDSELIGVYPIAGQMTVGSAEDTTIMLPYEGVEPHHFFLSPLFSQIGAISQDIRVNDTQLYQKRDLRIGDVIEFAGIRAEVEAVGVRGNE